MNHPFENKNFCKNGNDLLLNEKGGSSRNSKLIGK